jgi:hypothetical protein
MLRCSPTNRPQGALYDGASTTKRTMERPKLYLVSRNDSARPNAGRVKSTSSPQAIYKLPVRPPEGAASAKASEHAVSERPRILRRAIWDDESSWDSI